MRNRQKFFYFQIFFVVSILFNGLMAGVLISSPQRSLPPGPPPMAGGPEHILNRATDSLSPEKQQVIKPLISAHVETIENGHKEVFQKISALRDILIAEKLDEKAFHEAMKSVEASHMVREEHMHELLMQLVEKLNDEERIEFFKQALPSKPFSPPFPPPKK